MKQICHDALSLSKQILFAIKGHASCPLNDLFLLQHKLHVVTWNPIRQLMMDRFRSVPMPAHRVHERPLPKYLHDVAVFGFLIIALTSL